MVTTSVIMPSNLLKPIGFTLEKMVEYAHKRGNHVYAEICFAALECGCTCYKFDLHQFKTGKNENEVMRKYLTLTLEFQEKKKKYAFLDRYAVITTKK